MSYYDEKGSSRDTGRVDRRAPHTSPESMIEDEEDYQEFVRSMNRKRGRTEDRGRQRGRSSGDSFERTARGTEGSRDHDDTGYRPAGDLDTGERNTAAGNRNTGNGRRRESGSQEPVRINGSEGSGNDRENREKRRKGGIGGIILKLFLILLLLVAIAGGFLFFKMRNVLKLQRVNSIDLEEQLVQRIPYKVRSDEYMNGYKNIALFGVDSRSGDLLEGDNRSDTMMICSINEKSGEIKLVSVYRDTLLDVGDGACRKANTAYALGGPAQAIDMLNKNLDLNIVDFVTVGFEGLAHTIDALGGIEIEIDEEERGYLNQYVHDMHIELGTDDTPVEESGLVKLTGIQATAYSRIRYTAGDDFRRAERQRTVLSKTMDKAKKASPATLVKVADNVMGDVATSLSSSELIGLIVMAGKAELADTAGLPLEEYRAFRSSYEEGDYVLPADLSDNVIWLHEFLFGDSGYTLSEEVEGRNEAIRDYGINNSWESGY